MTTKQELKFDSAIAILTILIATLIVLCCKCTVYTTIAMGALGGVFYVSAKGVVKALMFRHKADTCLWKACPDFPGYYNSPHIKQQMVNAGYITIRPFCSKCGKQIELVK